jgi:hypothetical protein
MKIFTTKAKVLAGTNYAEVYKLAYYHYISIKKRSKRRPYVRSAYFKKEKIFLGLFWHHLHDKLNLKEKTRRLKFFSCALDLIQNSRFEPTTKINPNCSSEILHRFFGMDSTNIKFFVQIKEDLKTKEKFLISVFPE